MGFCSTSNFRKKTKNWQENTHRSTKTCQEVNNSRAEHRSSDMHNGLKSQFHSQHSVFSYGGQANFIGCLSARGLAFWGFKVVIVIPKRLEKFLAFLFRLIVTFVAHILFSICKTRWSTVQLFLENIFHFLMNTVAISALLLIFLAIKKGITLHG